MNAPNNQGNDSHYLKGNHCHLGQSPGSVRLTLSPGSVRLTLPPGSVRLTLSPGPVRLTLPPGSVRLTLSPGSVRLTLSPGPVRYPTWASEIPHLGQWDTRNWILNVFQTPQAGLGARGDSSLRWSPAGDRRGRKVDGDPGNCTHFRPHLHWLGTLGCV